MTKSVSFSNLKFLLPGLSAVVLVAGVVLSAPASAGCTPIPSASAFFRFMQFARSEALEQQDVLLAAQAGSVGCRAVFELKVLDHRGRVGIRVYDAEDFSLLSEESADEVLDWLNDELFDLEWEEGAHQQDGDAADDNDDRG